MRGQGDVHDGDVEDDHELGHQHQGEDGPGPPGLGLVGPMLCPVVRAVVCAVRVSGRLALVTVTVAGAMGGVGDRRWGGVVRHGRCSFESSWSGPGLGWPVDSTLPSEPPPSRRVNHRVPAAGRPRAGPSGYGCSGTSGALTPRQTGGDPVTSR